MAHPFAAEVIEAARRFLGEEAAAVVARLVEEAGPEEVIHSMEAVLRRRQEVLV